MSNSASSGINYDAMTRNTNKQCQSHRQASTVGYSDRKQLSTVEEENPSQCSDLTSVNQHQSRFGLTQHSSVSRKSHIS